MSKFEQPDGEGCARAFALVALALICAGVGLGVLLTIVLGLIFD